MNTTIDDVDTHIVYSNNPAWDTGVWSGQTPQPLFGTNHGSPHPGATVTLRFIGTAVYVYGYRGNDHGFRSISLDGATPLRCNGKTPGATSRALVYWANGLSSGTHEVTLQQTGNEGEYLNIDYFIVTNADGNVFPASSVTQDNTGSVAGTGPYPTNTQSSNNNNSNQSSTPIGIIAGVVAAFAVLFLISIIWLFWSRRRKARKQLEKDDARNANVMSAAGLPRDSQTVHPFYTPEAAPMLNHHDRQGYPESSSGYFSQGASQSVYSSVPPSTYSPPATQVQYNHGSVSPPLTTTGTMSATPWATPISGQTAGQKSEPSSRDPSIAKTRYSGANSLGTSSSRPLSPPTSSRPLSPPTVDDTVPPPRYEQ